MRTKEIDYITKVLSKENSYHLFWVSVTAYDAAGSPQQRKRWYMLGIKKDADYNLPQLAPLKTYFFKEPVGRTTRALAKGEVYSRISLLGNGVVAPAVVNVWNELSLRAKHILSNDGTLDAKDMPYSGYSQSPKVGAQGPKVPHER